VPEADGLVLGRYRPEESGDALALERLCPQGTSYRLSFRRPTFHRRAETYDEWRIVTARLEGSLVGLVAGAIKPVELWGEAMRAAFFFDLRVHPAVRGRGVARGAGPAQPMHGYREVSTRGRSMRAPLLVLLSVLGPGLARAQGAASTGYGSGIAEGCQSR